PRLSRRTRRTDMAHSVTAQQLGRVARLYVRQSTRQQVLEHGESTARQYALRERAVALGWADEHVIVIDQDLGHSDASMADRPATSPLGLPSKRSGASTPGCYRGKQTTSADCGGPAPLPEGRALFFADASDNHQRIVRPI